MDYNVYIENETIGYNVIDGAYDVSVTSADTGGSGAVNSVNGKKGNVVLTASDVGALPDTTVIPDAYDDTEIREELDGKASVAQFRELYTTVLGKANQSEVNSLKESIANKANSADVYTKSEIDSMIGGIDALATAISEVVGA